MRQAWKIADLTILTFENQLGLLRFALCEIQKWAGSESDERSPQLVMQVDSCVTCCRLLIGKIDHEVSQFEKTAAGNLELGSKLALLFKTKDMEQIQRMVDQQTHTLTLLLSACNSNALEEQRKTLQQPKAIRAFEEVDRDTASLIVHRDTDSIVTATSVSSSRWSVQFAFDKELFITRVYERWIRNLATMRRTQSQVQSNTSQENKQQSFDSDLSLSNRPSQIEGTIMTRTDTMASGRSSRSSLSLGERITSFRRSAKGQESQPLAEKLQAEESHRIDQKLKDESKLASREIKAVIFGLKIRKRMFEEMRRFSGQPCYTNEQLAFFRPIIFETLIRSVKYLAEALQHDRIIDEMDTAQHWLESMLSDEELNPETGLDSEFATTVRSIMEHPATKALMEDNDFNLPDNGEYFLNEIDRLSSDGYIPTDQDAIKCTEPLPNRVEANLDKGDLCMRLTDPGSATASSTSVMEPKASLTPDDRYRDCPSP
ncbi:uncharacterized protein BKA55DRAFT_540604 [Fusarium redolens]|uniref:Uncharacterized protein n=1 Tax=Fusarium redolens TaxID=48865 RepID=A0A9P9K431_FUSRE|nr:uncharacterized protein BKA55DRAFT_540604 [Fusarium redolens]KAH7247273.1 hypothetical protein BKA55DRAFT_540604 [Fusarium redolens]